MAVSGICPAGYYCPQGTTSGTANMCPAGTYSITTGLHDVSQCVACPKGSYCSGGSSLLNCPGGTYGSVTNLKSSDPSQPNSCRSCPAGYKCVAGSVAPVECGIGYFSDVSAIICRVCPLGHYCASKSTTLASLAGGRNWANSAQLSGGCFSGTYCPLGQSLVPNLVNAACPAGYYCPVATLYPMPCPAGKYSSLTGQDSLSDCVAVPAGYYSVQASDKITGLCNPGYYCPAESTSPEQVACPARFYRSEKGGRTVSDCSLCISGGYCPEGSSEPSICPRGFYCDDGVSAPAPCAIGTYGNSTGLRQSRECTVCDPGHFCDSPGLLVPTDLCAPGFYCAVNNIVATPRNGYNSTNNAVGGICLSGHYCPAGSHTSIPCPPGTFNSFTGSTASVACIPCTNGYYCSGFGNSNATGKCMQGFYCDGGASVPNQHEA